MDQLPDEIVKLLEDIDQAGHPLSDGEVADRIRERRGPKPKGEENQAVRAEVIGFSFAVYPGQEVALDQEYFQSLMSGIREDGSVVKFPDRDDIPVDFIPYWERRSHDAQHPVLRARYADLVWDLARETTGEPPDVAMARTAVDSYLDSAERHLTPNRVEVRQKAARALSLALTINDLQRVERAKHVILSLDEVTSEGELPGEGALAFDLLLLSRTKVGLTESEECDIIRRQESILADSVKAAASASPEKPVGDADPFLLKQVALRLANYYRKHDRQEDVRRALEAYRTVFSSIAPAASGLVASAWLEHLHEDLLSFGLRSEADATAVLLRETGKRISGEMKTITTHIEIPTETLERLASDVLQGSVEEMCARIAGTFLPRRDRIKRKVDEVAKAAPLLAVVSPKLLDADGRTVARIGDVGEDPEGRMVHQLAQDLVPRSPYLRYVLEKFQEMVEPAILLQTILKSPLFDPDQEPILRTGIEAHWRNDYITSLHVLVPQIERGLRRVLELRAIALYKPSRSGGFNLKNLDDALREAVTTDVLGLDFVFYAKTLLTDQRGLCLRHDLAHGIMTPDRMTWVCSDRVIHVLLYMGSARTKREGQSETVHS